MNEETTSYQAHVDTDASWRNRKREQTKQRIYETALALLHERGFEAVTLDEIADAAGIGKRTFHRYFESKEEVLLGYQDLLEEDFEKALAKVADDVAPFEAMRLALAETHGITDPEEAKAVDDLMRSTDALRARKQAGYVRLENFVYERLIERWPDPSGCLQLRMFALIGVGAIRVASDRWSTDGAKRDWKKYFDEAIGALSLPI